MTATARVTSFVLGLAVIGGAAAGLGVAVGPVQVTAGSHSQDHRDPDGATAPSGGHDGHEQPTEAEAPPTTELPGGLTVTQDGYSLELLQDRLARPGRARLRLRVNDPSGAAVTSYEESHGKDLHLIVVRRDLSDYRHVHPVLGDAGTWSVPITLPRPGEYRVFADFEPEGSEVGYTLGHDLSVAGTYRPAALPATSRTARVGQYEVRLDGELEPGATSQLTASVTRGGTPVTDVQPYLGAYGHLVALRDHDLAYLHVHPEGEPGDGVTAPGPDVTFEVEVPSAGDFRIFFDFRHGDRVRTAAFTLPAGTQGAAGERAEPIDPETDPHSH